MRNASENIVPREGQDRRAQRPRRWPWEEPDGGILALAEYEQETLRWFLHQVEVHGSVKGRAV